MGGGVHGFNGGMWAFVLGCALITKYDSRRAKLRTGLCGYHGHVTVTMCCQLTHFVVNLCFVTGQTTPPNEPNVVTTDHTHILNRDIFVFQ